jgi:biopolymer transport protein ExbD
MARKQYDNPKAEMTPMIDVVFQLMIFFIVTIKQEDIFSKLNANRPAPNASSAQSEENDTQIKIDIGKPPSRGPHFVVLNGRSMPFKTLDENIKKLAASSTKSTVLVRCTLDSHHGDLVHVLDICNKYKMYNLSIFSM